MGLHCAAGDKGANCGGSLRETEAGLSTLCGAMNETAVVTQRRTSEPGTPRQGGRGINWLC